MKPLDQDLRALADAGLLEPPDHDAVMVADREDELGPDPAKALQHAMGFRRDHEEVVGWTQTTSHTFPRPIEGEEGGLLLALEWCAPAAGVTLRIRHVGDRFHAWTLRSARRSEDAATVVRRHARTGGGAWRYHVTWTLQDGALRPWASRLVDAEPATPHRTPKSQGDR